MGKFFALYNPKAGNGTGLEKAQELKKFAEGKDVEFVDSTGIQDLKAYLAGLNKDDSIVLCGGDGTIAYFINHTYGDAYVNDIYYFPCGSGNDFFRDVCNTTEPSMIKINQYLENLPVATVKGKEYVFLDNVGFGIDGYCCQVGDEMRARHMEKINYTSIAIKGLLGKFKPVTATVTVDGKTEVFKKAWLAPTMKGRYYGGGMMATPAQDRLSADGKVSVLLFYGHGSLPTLAAFPSIFKGEHIKHTNMVKIIEGYDVTVKFDKPCAAQIDGETILDVTEYTVRTKNKQ